MRAMSIRIITENKKDFLPLLLLGDEQESQINKYLDRGDLFALYNGDLKSVCAVTDEGNGTLEIQNLATDKRYQRNGYASRLIDYIAKHYAGRYDRIILGTGDVPGILAFYGRRGFIITHRIPDYFTTHYDHPIIEDGVLLKDKVYLEKKLRAEDMIKGNIIELAPATLNDKQKIYDWCFHSETTKSHSGPPDYPENPIATWEEFFDEGYVDYFFTGSQPDNGRGFMILHDGEAVGFISYCSFHLKPNKSELDIWMNSEANCGKGFGVDAIVSLGAYLHENMGINELIMRPSARNERAIKAYTKAGFEKTDKLPSDYLLDEYIPLYGEGDYGAGGDVLLCKQFDI